MRNRGIGAYLVEAAAAAESAAELAVRCRPGAPSLALFGQKSKDEGEAESGRGGNNSEGGRQQPCAERRSPSKSPLFVLVISFPIN
jgi:hypothetical protein